MRSHRSVTVIVTVTLAVAAASLSGALLPAHAVVGSFDDPAFCSATIAAQGDGALTPEQHHSCMIAIASTYLDAQQNTLEPSRILFDDAVARYQQGKPAVHTAGNAAALRAEYPTTITAVTNREWAVDGDLAVATFQARTTDSPDTTKYYETMRFTLRAGLIWEIMTTLAADPTGTAGPQGPLPVNPVVGVEQTGNHDTPDFSDPIYCSNFIGEHGDAALTPDQHRQCMQAIALTYIKAEDNEADAQTILLDPRVSRYSEGGQPNHQYGNDNAIRYQEGTVTAVIRSISNRQWVVDGNDAWISYDGYLVISTDRPGFYVTERIRMRNGLIWEIMITPVQTDVTPHLPS